MTKGNFYVSTDKSKLDIDMIHGFLTQSYWSMGIPRTTVERTIQHSLCFGVFSGQPDDPNTRAKQVGFARVLTDFAAIAYLGDVFILDALVCGFGNGAVPPGVKSFGSRWNRLAGCLFSSNRSIEVENLY